MSIPLIIVSGLGALAAFYIAFRVTRWTLAWAKRSHHDGVPLTLSTWLGDALDSIATDPSYRGEGNYEPPEDLDPPL